MARELKSFLITPPEGPREELLGIAGRALQGGVQAIIVRRPRGTAREVFEITRRLRPGTRREGCRLIVSDRIDVALAADADGVHLGVRSLPTAAARRILPNGLLLGRSVHNLDEVAQQEERGADYLFLGPIFPTDSHPDGPTLGILPYKEAVLRSRIPVIAIGGMEPDSVGAIAAAGGDGVAAIAAFRDAADPAEVARRFRAAFGT